MRPIAAFVVSVWTIGIAAPASAQTAPNVWAHLQKLDPGTEIAVTPKGSYVPRQRYFLAASESQLITLNLSNPALPRAAKNLLRSAAESNSTFLMSAETSGASLSEDEVKLAADGIYLRSAKVGDLSDVIERLSRDEVAAITWPGGGPLVLNRPFEVGLSATGVLTWPAVGGDLKLAGSFPISERHSLELFAGPFSGDSSNFGDYEQIKAFYGVQVRQTIGRGARPGVEPFISYGALGVISTFEERTCVQGRCFVSGRSTHTLPPLVGMIGGGVQYTLASRLALRVEAGGLVAFVLPVGVKISLGFTVPVGQSYTKRNEQRTTNNERLTLCPTDR